MKKGNGKGAVVLIVLLVVIALIVFLGIKMVGNKKGKEIDGDKKAAVENVVVKYFTTMTTGVGTVYNGTDVLYQKDKTTFEDLNDVYVLNAAFNYCVDKGTAEVSDNVAGYIKRVYQYDTYLAIKGEEVRKAIKNLFGVEFKDKGAELFNFNYTFVYDESNDFYIRIPNEKAGIAKDYFVYTKPVSIVEKDKKIEVELAVAYVYGAGNYYTFTKEPSLKTVVSEGSKYEMDESKINEFDHYTITLRQDGDNYIFESIQKK